MTHVNEELPRNAPTGGGAEYDRDRGRNTSRQPNHYPAPPPSANTAMNVDDEEGRVDRYPRVLIFFLNIFKLANLFMNFEAV